MSKMAVFGLQTRIFRTQGHNSVLWGAIRVYFSTYRMVLSRCFAEGCSGNQVEESGLDTAALQIALQKKMAPVRLQ